MEILFLLIKSHICWLNDHCSPANARNFNPMIKATALLSQFKQVGLGADDVGRVDGKSYSSIWPAWKLINRGKCTNS